MKIAELQHLLTHEQYSSLAHPASELLLTILSSLADKELLTADNIQRAITLSKQTEIEDFIKVILALRDAELIADQSLKDLISLCDEAYLPGLSHLSYRLGQLHDHFLNDLQNLHAHWRLFLDQQTWEELVLFTKSISALEPAEANQQMRDFVVDVLGERYTDRRPVLEVAENPATLEREYHDLARLFCLPPVADATDDDEEVNAEADDHVDVAALNG